jgi:hypothetical protein
MARKRKNTKIPSEIRALSKKNWIEYLKELQKWRKENR